MVTVYRSAEQFFHEFRQEHIALYQKEWSGDARDVDPLTVTLRNIDSGEDRAAEKVGRDLISRFQYYRVVRNWAVHTKDSDLKKPRAKYDEITEYSDAHKTLFASLSVPNPPDKLNFDDFIFFSRLTKMIAERICQISQPPSDHWLRVMPLTRFKRLKTNPKRMRNAVAGRLKTHYGMDDATAKWISDELCGSLA